MLLLKVSLNTACFLFISYVLKPQLPFAQVWAKRPSMMSVLPPCYWQYRRQSDGNWPWHRWDLRGVGKILGVFWGLKFSFWWWEMIKQVNPWDSWCVSFALRDYIRLTQLQYWGVTLGKWKDVVTLTQQLVMKCDIQAAGCERYSHDELKPFREEASCYVCRKYEVYRLGKELKPQMTTHDLMFYIVLL